MRSGTTSNAQVLNTSEDAIAAPVALAQPFLCAWPCFVPWPTAPLSWQSPQSVGWFSPFCFWCVGLLQCEISLKRDRSWDTSLAAHPPGLRTLVHFTENMLSWRSGANQLVPRHFMARFLMVFPLGRHHFSGRSCQISTFPRMCHQTPDPKLQSSWRSSKDISIGFAFSVFCAWLQLRHTTPDPSWNLCRPAYVCDSWISQLPSPVQIKPKLCHVPDKELPLRCKL